jgi:mRNA-degrading endonuclease RelE of RelBE toxin-antitoxin system
MTDRSPYRLEFDARTAFHLSRIERKYHSLIRATISQQLSHRPGHETRNRKPLDRPMSFGASWELRFGPSNRFRVFYHVDEDRREVVILAIGVEQRNRLLIGDEEFQE